MRSRRALTNCRPSRTEDAKICMLGLPSPHFGLECPSVLHRCGYVASLLRRQDACQRGWYELAGLAQSCRELASIAAVDDQVAKLPQRSGVVDALEPPR